MTKGKNKVCLGTLIKPFTSFLKPAIPLNRVVASSDVVVQIF